MLENILNAITCLLMDRLGRNLGDHIPSCAWHVRDDAVAMATAVATAHWTFCSYGRLEAERVNQFWWNLVYKLGPQWQSCDQILKVGGRSLLESIRNAITRLQMDHWDATLVVASRHVPNIGNALTPLTMGPIETTLGCSHPSNTSAAKPFPWYWSLLLTAILMKIGWLCHCGTKKII